MSAFFSAKYASLVPYTPGEQPQERKYVKLNTNESPFPPSAMAVRAAAQELLRMELYSDPECHALNAKIAEVYGVAPDEVLMTNGSDEILNFAFMAFCDASTPALFPDITYGFYPVFARLNGVPYTELPLRDDLMIETAPYMNAHATIFLANPNAPTGILLPRDEVERIIAANPDNVVVVDEAYIDFASPDASCVPLIRKYRNLLVTQTFSKSRSMAGARLGMGFACRELIADLNTVKYSTNPYNVNRVTAAAGIGALSDEAYTKRNCDMIVATRSYLTEELRALGFSVTDSSANFVFAAHPFVSGQAIYEGLRERGVLVRHFSIERIKDYNRITVGTREQTDILLNALRAILGGTK